MSKYSDRRTFIKHLMAAGIVFQLPLLGACEQSVKEEEFLSARDMKIFNSVINIIFPKELGPNAEEINVSEHLKNILSDSLLDVDENQYILNGFQWVEETAVEIYKKSYHQLSQNRKKKLIRQISEESWGENWLSKLLTIIFEALLLDDIYQINPNGVGWKWLQHQPGSPRPNKSNVYPEILKRKKEHIIITKLSQL